MGIGFRFGFARRALKNLHKHISRERERERDTVSGPARRRNSEVRSPRQWILFVRGQTFARSLSKGCRVNDEDDGEEPSAPIPGQSGRSELEPPSPSPPPIGASRR